MSDSEYGFEDGLDARLSELEKDLTQPKEESEKAEGSSKQNEVEFYDSEADDIDEKYLQNKVSTKRTDGTVWTTDAVLSCAMCLNIICYDCQRHDRFHNQYRAMFVTDVVLKLSERLWFPKSETCDLSKPKHSLKVPTLGPNATIIDEPAQYLDQDSFFAAHCQNCEAQVGLYDHEEIYHLFGVIASQP